MSKSGGDWIEGYRQALKDTLTRSGQVVDGRNYYGSHTFYDGYVHRHGGGFTERERSIAEWCGGWAEISTPEEEVVYEFMGTDYSGDRSTHIVTATVTCNCGLIKDKTLEYRGTLSELIAEVLKDNV